MITGADYFRDVGLHRQLTVEMDAEITNRLHRSDHCGASIAAYCSNFGHCVLVPLWGGAYGATYDDNLRLIKKRVVDSLVN